jgi:hypothetical protein
MRIVGRVTLLLMAVVGVLTVTSTQSGALTKAQLRGKLFSLADLPAGWVVASSPPKATATGCFSHAGLSHLKKLHLKGSVVQVDFDRSATAQFLGETLATGKGIGSQLTKLNSYAQHCKPFTLNIDGQTLHFVVKPLAMPSEGAHSSAYAMEFAADGTPFYLALISFEIDNIAANLGIEGVGTPNLPALEQIVLGAKDKMTGVPDSAVHTT